MSVQYAQKLENRVQNKPALLSLLKKGAVNELSSDDKQQIRKGFIEILQAIPEFKIVMLPDEFLTYENLLRVFPKQSITRLLA